jgi:CheY-like chemotaxis protein
LSPPFAPRLEVEHNAVRVPDCDCLGDHNTEADLSAPSRTCGSGMRNVMVVDDDPNTCVFMQALLELQGYAVTCAANGQEALSHLREGRLPSVILLDLSMPVMNGRQFRQHQLQDPDLANIPVVLVSGAFDLPRAAVALEVAAYLAKPVECGSLVRAVHAIALGNAIGPG